MRLKLTLVGAGSRSFGPATIRDIMLSDSICEQDLDVMLMDLSAPALERTRDYANAVAANLRRNPRISVSTNLEEALENADFVVTAIEIRRMHYWAQDFHVPRKHGFNQIYGENGGPGGLFHALRNMKPMLDIVHAMERVCPDAWMLNYTNPLAKLCEAMTRLSTVKVIGLCHGVFHGKQQLCKLLDIKMEDLDAEASGLNHFTWFQSIRDRKTGEDLYPLLKGREKEAHWLAEWDEIALSRIMLRTFGLYPSPGANHIGEYVRWADAFLASSPLQFFYDPLEGHPWETGEMPAFIYNMNENPTSAPLFAGEIAEPFVDPMNTENIEPSGELAIPIIEGVFCGVEQELAAVNIPNAGYMPGLPDETVVEVPATVDAKGLHPKAMPMLPESILALLRTQASIGKLLVEAYSENSRNKLLQALLLDPTTHSYRSAVDLINEMCELQAEVLPELGWLNG